MKARLNILLLAILALTFVVSSCGSSNNVVSNRLIQKRKYTKGWHINKSKKSKDNRSSSKDNLDEASPSSQRIVSNKQVIEKKTELENKTKPARIENNEPAIDSEIETVNSHPTLSDSQPENNNPTEPEKNSDYEKVDLEKTEIDQFPGLFPSIEMGPILTYILAGFALAVVITGIVILLVADDWFILLGLILLIWGIILAIWAIIIVVRDNGDTAPYSLVLSLLAFVAGTIAAILFFLEL